MKRRQLFEFTDLGWWPASFRALLTDYLMTCLQLTHPFRRLYSALSGAIEAARTDRVVDLGSGSGGPWPHLLGEMRRATGRAIQVLLTDKYPDAAASGRFEGVDGIRYWPEPVDARAGPAELAGLRTMFNSLHHFRPAAALEILRDAVRHGEPIAIIENVYRSWFCVFGALFVPFVVLAVTPWIRPFSWRRWFWTYVIPLAPLVIAWDGAISVARCYNPADLRAMGRQAAGDTYDWQSGAYQQGIMTVTYLIGLPRVVAAGRGRPV